MVLLVYFCKICRSLRYGQLSGQHPTCFTFQQERSVPASCVDMFSTNKMTCIRGQIYDRLHIVASTEVMESIIHVVYAPYMLCYSVTSYSFRQFNISGMSAKQKGRLQTGGLQQYTVQCAAGEGLLKMIIGCHSRFLSTTISTRQTTVIKLQLYNISVSINV